MQTLVLEMFGVCGLLVQTVVLRYMLAWLGEARVLTVGLTAALVEMLLVSFITAKWQVRALMSPHDAAVWPYKFTVIYIERERLYRLHECPAGWQHTPP